MVNIHTKNEEVTMVTNYVHRMKIHRKKFAQEVHHFKTGKDTYQEGSVHDGY